MNRYIARNKASFRMIDLAHILLKHNNQSLLLKLNSTQEAILQFRDVKCISNELSKSLNFQFNIPYHMTDIFEFSPASQTR